MNRLPARFRDDRRSGAHNETSDRRRSSTHHRNEDRLKLKVLRAQIKAGTDALDRGDFAEVDDADLEEHLERLTIPAVKSTR